MRQGSLNVATWVIVNGRLGSGFCSPALICARAVADTSVRSSAAFRSVFMYVSPSLTNFRDQLRVSHRIKQAIAPNQGNRSHKNTEFLDGLVAEPAFTRPGHPAPSARFAGRLIWRTATAAGERAA